MVLMALSTYDSRCRKSSRFGCVAKCLAVTYSKMEGKTQPLLEDSPKEAVGKA